MTELSRRDQFAMAAMAAIIPTYKDDRPESPSSMEVVAAWSVCYANALIAELDNTGCKHNNRLVNHLENGPYLIKTVKCEDCGKILQ